MEREVLQRKLTLETAPVHVAPGGSVLYHVKGRARGIGEVLVALREETAYGMCDVVTLGEDEVDVAIYFGRADEASVLEVLEKHSGIETSREELAEAIQMTGLSMRARNQVIDVLK